MSFAAPQDLEYVHRIGQSVMLDNGAFTQWKKNPIAPMYVWDAYYEWARPWLEFQTTWAVIPDVINGTEEANDKLLIQWDDMMGMDRHNVAPVWHVHESFDRLMRLLTGYHRVCFGSSGQYSVVGSDSWNRRMNETFNFIQREFGRIPRWIHMLRGMSLAGSIYPFASLDSTDIARNHNRPQNDAAEMAAKWDAQQNQGLWLFAPTQRELAER